MDASATVVMTTRQSKYQPLLLCRLPPHPSMQRNCLNKEMHNWRILDRQNCHLYNDVKFSKLQHHYIENRYGIIHYSLM